MKWRKAELRKSPSTKEIRPIDGEVAEKIHKRKYRYFFMAFICILLFLIFLVILIVGSIVIYHALDNPGIVKGMGW